MRRVLVLVLVGSAALIGLGPAPVASADPYPSITSFSVTPTAVVLSQGQDATVTMIGTVELGTEFAIAHASFSLSRIGEPEAVTGTIASADGGLTWTGSAVIPWTEKTGVWTAHMGISASDGVDVETAPFSVKSEPSMSLSFEPSKPYAGSNYYWVQGTVKGLDDSDPSGYAALANKHVTITGPDGTHKSTTDARGEFLHIATIPAGPGDLWTATFAGDVGYLGGTVETTMSTLRNRTRFVSFNASPEPAYRHGYLTVSGTLERVNPNNLAWLKYAGKLVTISRGTFHATTTTDSHGHFSLTVHGVTSTVAGTWTAAFAGTPSYAPSKSSGDQVATTTAPMRITKILFDVPGSDTRSNAKYNQEYVRITNKGKHIANLIGWTIRDKSGHVYTFSKSVYVKVGKSVTLHTGSGADTGSSVYWAQNNYIWDNGGDKAFLRNDRGASVDTCSYSGAGSSTTC